ncbi:host cell division inhibitor Icd-like protein [Testudinibacter sp. P27/CKL/0425]
MNIIHFNLTKNEKNCNTHQAMLEIILSVAGIRIIRTPLLSQDEVMATSPNPKSVRFSDWINPVFNRLPPMVGVSKFIGAPKSNYAFGSMPREESSLRKIRFIHVANVVSPSTFACSSSCLRKSSCSLIWYCGDLFSTFFILPLELVRTISYSLKHGNYHSKVNAKKQTPKSAPTPLSVLTTTLKELNIMANFNYTQKTTNPELDRLNFQNCDTNHFTKDRTLDYFNTAVAKSAASFDRLNPKAYSRLTNPKQRYFYVCNNPSYIQNMTGRNGETVRSASIFWAGLSTLLRLVTLFDSGEQGYKTYQKVITMKTYLFAGIRRTDLSNQIHSLRILADSEQHARALLARDYVLAFAGRINRTFDKSPLTQAENAVSISGTNTDNGRRTRKPCGFFVPQIHQDGLLTQSKAEFVARSISRNKADYIRTNKANRLSAVVEALPHLLQVGKSITKTDKRKFTMKTPNPTQVVSTSCVNRTFTATEVQGVIYA